jgi:Ca2+-transporting ATPase
MKTGMQKTNWHVQTVVDVAREWKTSLETGLASGVARKRLEAGRNVIAEAERPRPLSMLASQFTDTMVLVLLAATLLSGLLGDIIDAIVILTIVIINGILGFIQEYRAERSLEEIKKLSSPHATVVRDGKRQRIAAEEVVKGDMVEIEAGDRIPADMRLSITTSLEVEESCLTGESLPVRKTTDVLSDPKLPLGDRSNMAYMGTVVTRGRGRGVVVATGPETVMGEIAQMIKEPTDQTTPLQHRLNNLGKVLILICLGACLAVMIMGLYRGENLVRMIMAGISLAVAAIPEGLPAIVTVVLALGVQRMAKRKAIVRKLPAVETLGCTTVICSDKTGTLTQNEMTVRVLSTIDKEVFITGEGYSPQGEFLIDGGNDPLGDPALRLAIEIGYHCNHADVVKENGRWLVQGDPTEGALKVMGRKAGLKRAAPILREVPFESERKMMSVVIKNGKGYRVLCKGALDVLISNCSRIETAQGSRPFSAAHRQWFTDRQEEWAGQAYRVLALAYRDISEQELRSISDQKLESNLCLVGICGIIDPPRPAVLSAVTDCRQAGIVPIMITGDHPATACAVAQQTGISDGQVVIGPDDIDRLSLKELADKALEIRVFARVSPQHKLKIVKALKSRNHVVAMTGDGVNDAPALKEADIGVAMGITGTEVTKEASDMVLADDDFSTIVAAVHEGRAIYDNIRKFIRYLLGGNIGEILTMFLASLIGMPLPLLPLQILWVNLVTDGLPAMALGLEPPEPGVMERKPRPANESVFARGLGWHLIGRGVYIGISTLLVMAIGLTYSGFKGGVDLELARTMAFTNLVFAQLFYVFDCRSERFSPFELGFFKNPFLVGAVCCSVLMHLFAIYYTPMNPIFGTTPLDGWAWAVILAITGGGMLVRWCLYWIRKSATKYPQYGKLENIGTSTT